MHAPRTAHHGIKESSWREINRVRLFRTRGRCMGRTSNQTRNCTAASIQPFLDHYSRHVIMDVEVEMTDTSRAVKDGIVAAEDLELDEIHGRPVAQRQNSCFFVWLAAFTIAMAVFVIGTVYLSPGELPATENEFSPESGVVGNNQAKVEEAFATIQNSKHHNSNSGGLDTWMKEHGFTNTTDGIKALPKKGGSSLGKHHATIIAGNHQHVSGHTIKDVTETAPTTAAAVTKVSQDMEAWHAAPVTLNDGVQYEIVEQLIHDKEAFTEGLAYANGLLYESTGLNGQSSIRTLDPHTGQVIESFPVSQEYFGEGLTIVNDKLIQLTWKSKTGFVYDAKNLTKPPETFSFSTKRSEGWGLTYDAEKDELVVSDGSDSLFFWDPHTFEELRRLQVVRQSGQPAKNINELEWWRGRVLANVWYEDTIIVINPETGVVEKEYDFRDLYPYLDRKQARADVLNGISISEDPDILYVTGKDWDRMFRLRLLP